MRIAPKTAGAFAVGAFLFLLIFGVAWPGPGAWLLVFGLLFIAVGAAAWWLDGSTVPVQGAVAVGGRGAAALSMGRPGGTPFRGAGRTGDSLLLQLGLPGLDARGQWMLPDRVHVAVPAGITGLLALLIFLGGALGGGSAATPNVPAVQSHEAIDFAQPVQTLVPTVLTTATGTANPAAGAPVTAALAPITVEQPTTSRPAPRAPVVAENVARAQGATTVHKVVSGDTIYDLAITYNTTIEAIMTANAINEFGTLHVGDELIIPAPPEE